MSTERRVSARLAAPQPTVKLYIEPTVKDEPVFEKDILDIYGSIDDSYCRVCFRIFSIEESRLELDDAFCSVFREVIQIGFTLGCGSQWICSECNSTLNFFSTFKNDIIDKQAKFSQMIVMNEHQDIEKIQKLNCNRSSDESIKFYLKSEPEDELIESIMGEPVEKQVSKMKSKSKSSKLKTVTVKKKLIHKTKKMKRTNTLKTFTICPECGKKTCSLLNHRIRVHNYKHVFKCIQCTYSNTDKQKLHYHIKVVHMGIKQQRTHNLEQAQVCPYCAKLIRKNLDEHISNIHLGERHFFCDLCSFSGFKYIQIKQHMMHNHLPRNVKCPKCEFTTINKTRLRQHINNKHETHVPEFQCNIPGCTKRFRKQNYLQWHVKRCHEGGASYLCEATSCGKYFYSIQERRNHFQNSHCPKNIICDECGAAFSSLRMLLKHTEIHRECTKFCTYPECGMKFRKTTQLRNHVNRFHLHRKEHSCKECSDYFYTPTDLERHIISKHLGVRFDCTVSGCTSSFSRPEAYIFHLKQQHKDLSNDERHTHTNKLKEFCTELNANVKEQRKKMKQSYF